MIYATNRAAQAIQNVEVKPRKGISNITVLIADRYSSTHFCPDISVTAATILGTWVMASEGFLLKLPA